MAERIIAESNSLCCISSNFIFVIARSRAAMTKQSEILKILDCFVWAKALLAMTLKKNFSILSL